jgi:putative transposase
VILALVAEAQQHGARQAAACALLGVSTRTLERWRTGPGEDGRCGPKQRPPNALTAAEEAKVVAVMTSAAYANLSPKQVVPRLADEGRYVASESTMYRLQRRLGLRRTKRTASPERGTRACTVHNATGPNQVWSWDITWLPTTVRGKYLYLYLVMDVWSRRIVGWTVETRETPDLASALIQRICGELGVDTRGLVLHSDNGTAMRGSTMLATLRWLGIVPSFSRPHVSDDNPYSESMFRTLKHGPMYPRRPFADAETARRWVTRFVDWYNGNHRHSAIRFVTPDQRHGGEDVGILRRRADVYERARRRNPARWTGRVRNWSPIAEVVLNPRGDSASATA